MLSKDDKKKSDWKEINKVSMFKFKQVKYLLLALTTLYTPVTRNAIQMALCAPKYAYGKYNCFLNNTNTQVRKFYASPQESEAVNSCVDGYMFASKASDITQESKTYTVIAESTCTTYDSDTETTSPILTMDECNLAGQDLQPPNYGVTSRPLSDGVTGSTKYPAGCYWDGELRWNNNSASTATCTETSGCLCNYISKEPDDASPAYFSRSSSQTCDFYGDADITTLADCSAAAAALKLTITTAVSTINPVYPRGCSFDKFLKFRQLTGTTTKDASIRRICKKKKISYFKFTKKDCAKNGKASIASAADCSAAAVALKLSDLTASTSFSSTEPKGCWFSGTVLKFNTKTSSKDFTSGYQGICQSVRRRRLLRSDDLVPLTTASATASEWETFWDRRYLSASTTASAPRGYYTSRDGSVPNTNEFTPIPKQGYRIELVLPPMYPECFAGSHWWMVVLSVLVLIFFSLAFPRLMGKVIEYEKPKSLAADDPENPVFSAPNVPPAGPTDPSYLIKKALYDNLHGKPVIFNDEGKLVEYTDEIFLLEVNKQSDSPFTTMYKGFEMSWAKYKIFVMDLKLVQIFLMTLATCDILSRKTLTPQNSALFASVAAIVTTGAFLGFSCKANPYVDYKNDKM